MLRRIVFFEKKSFFSSQSLQCFRNYSSPRQWSQWFRRHLRQERTRDPNLFSDRLWYVRSFLTKLVFAQRSLHIQDATVTIVDASHMNLEIEGPISLKCDGEQYTLSGSSITLPTAGTAGDCIHDALAAHGGSIQGITYDSSADSLDVKVTVLSFLKVDIGLTHQSLRGVKTLTYVGNANASPSGTYKGSKSVLGQTVDGTITIVDATHMNLEIEGPISLKCDGEQYTLSGSTVTLPTAGTAGDCIHDALAAHGGSIDSITYDSSADSIDVKVKVLNFLNVDLTLTHQSALLPVHPDRLAQLYEITSTNGLLWKVDLNNRFSSQAPGASERMCGVKGNWKAQLEDRVRLGHFTRFEDSEHYLEDASIPDSFDSAENWPNCKKIINDIRDQSNCGCCWGMFFDLLSLSLSLTHLSTNITHSLCWS